MSDRVLEVDGVSKIYRLGLLNGRSFHDDLTSWIARKRGREDPNSKLGTDPSQIVGSTLMALNDVSFSLNRGDALSVVGLNGAGKSTLLKLISRITSPSAGEIRIRGHVSSMLEVGTGFHQDLSGRDNIYLNGAILGMSRAETTAKMKDIIEFSEIGPFIDTPVKRYSSGMYVKLGFAVAANLSPDILICDEVLAVGDLAFQQKCLAKMRDVANEGRAVIYVSHNMRTVSELCNRGIFLDKGRLKYDGTTEHAIELYSGSGIRDLDRDLSDMVRPKNRGTSMHMQHMRLLDTQSVEFEQDSTFRFTLTFDSKVSDPHMRLRVVLYSSMAAPISMAASDPIDVRAGERMTIDVRMSMDGLAPGEYSMKLSLTSATPDGGFLAYDTIDDVGHVIITEDPSYNDGFRWIERLWGQFRMKKLEVH